MSEQTASAPQAEGLDTFNSPTWTTTTQQDTNSQEENSGLDTFDNQEIVIPDSMEEEPQNQDDKGAEEQKPTEEDENTEKPEAKRETDKLEEQESDEKEDDGKDGDDSAPKEEEQDRSEDTGDKPTGKTIRVKEGDKAIDISPDATIPVKVKGRKEFVSIDDLRRDYSGRKAWTEEINTAKGKQAEVEMQMEQFEQQKEATKAHFAKIGEMIEDGFTNPEADPLAAMKYLVELSGRPVLDFEKRLMEHYSGLTSQFYEMEESEQNLYWSQRENEILRNNHAKQLKEAENRKAQEQRVQNLGSIREQYGVSEQDYQATESELENLGYDMSEVQPDQIAKYTALKPLVEEAGSLCQQFEEDLGDDEMDALITGTADTMFKFPQLDSTEALRISAKQLGYHLETEDDIVEELVEKVKGPTNRLQESNARRAVKTEEGAMETFDDFDELYYKRS